MFQAINTIVSNPVFQCVIMPMAFAILVFLGYVMILEDKEV